MPDVVWIMIHIEKFIGQ